ncbi:MAG: hypothetical protein IIC92_09145 [Chloroflexi bacterium]|nr:hypothetical protein [Chloroflexota bacterium]
MWLYARTHALVIVSKDNDFSYSSYSHSRLNAN